MTETQVIERHVTTADGVSLRTRVDGPEGAPPLLLVNSLGTDLHMWDPQVPVLSRSRRVLRFDLRGHGGSTVPAPPYTVEGFGADAVAVLDAYGVDRADVCGLSLGGLVALWVASHEPSRVTRLVVAGATARIGTEEGWQDRARAVRQGGMAAISDVVLARFFSPGFRATQADVVEQTRRTLERIAADGYLGACSALATADLRDAVSRIEAESLVVVGSQDEATPPHDVRALDAALPSSRFVELRGAGHLANLEVPTEFSDLVVRFLTASEPVDG